MLLRNIMCYVYICINLIIQKAYYIFIIPLQISYIHFHLQLNKMFSMERPIKKPQKNIKSKKIVQNINQIFQIINQISFPSNAKLLLRTNQIRTKYTPFLKQKYLVNPYLASNLQTSNYKQTVLSKSQKGHTMPVCSVVFHPKKPIIGTGSDDMLWKIWTVAQSELIMSGQGHKDWISSMKFHPKGCHYVTASGDSTVKIWDFVTSSCTHTYNNSWPISSIDTDTTGDVIASGSLDYFCRLLDINVGKCRTVLRGHDDSINSVHFKPYSNLLATASADKTISTWDIRTGLCVQTFYGHQNSVNGCKFSIKGDKLASCDSNGIVKVWDLKTGSQQLSFDCDRSSAHCLGIDRSGTIIGVGCDDGLIRLFNSNTGQKQHTLKGHDEKTRVQAIQFDMNSKMIVSGGSDCSYRIWQ